MQAACTAAGVKSIYDYVSADPEELADFLDDESVDAAEALAPEEWLGAEEGLEWAGKLAAYLAAHSAAIESTPEVLADLIEYRSVFEGLQHHGVRWHFAIDF